MKDIFEKYLLELRKAYTQQGTEHSGRTALENFLNAVAAKVAPKAHVQHEPKRHWGKVKGQMAARVGATASGTHRALRLSFAGCLTADGSADSFGNPFVTL